MDVLLNPFQGEVLVEESSVGNTSFGLERGTGEEAKGTESVVESHVDDAVAPIFLADFDKPGGITTVMIVLLPS